MNKKAEILKESDELIDYTSSFKAILEIIKQTDVNNEESQQNTFERMSAFFSSNSLNETDIDSEFIELSKQLISLENSIEIVRFGIRCFAIMIVQRNLVTDFAFLQNVIDNLTPLSSISDEYILTNLFLIYGKLASPSEECALAIMSVVDFQVVENIIKTSTNIEFIHATLSFYCSICKTLGNKLPTECLQSAFSCIVMHIQKILPSLETTSVDPGSMQVLIDIVKFLTISGSNVVWDTCFKDSGLLPYCNTCLLSIKKTTLRIQVLKLMKRICNNPRIEPSEINYERIFELMHHSNAAISQEAVNCIFSVNHVDLNRMIENTDLVAHIIDLIINQTYKIQEKCISFILKHSNSIDWNVMLNQDLIAKLYDIIDMSDKKMQEKISQILVNILKQAEKVGEECFEEMKNTLIELDAVDRLTEISMETISPPQHIITLLSIIEPEE